jgi:Ca2+-binding EF-hand superfamily protein
MGWSTTGGKSTDGRTRSNSPASISGERRDEDAVRRVFSNANKKNDGYLSADELETIMHYLGMPRKHAQKLLKAADTDEDGLLDSEEFLAWIFSSNPHAVMALSRITCHGA